MQRSHFFGILLATLTFTAANAAEEWVACFTPGENCTGLIVEELGKARRTVEVQAYSFTSAPIAKALVDAKTRGVDVRVILDKSQKSERYSSLTFLANAKIPVWIDYQVAIAHNKVMVIDDHTVVTGSFNFTKSAQDKNAENILVVKDRELAKRYHENWNARRSVSTQYQSSQW